MLAILGQDALNFVLLMIFSFGLLFVDLGLWMSGRKTFSETIWRVNQVTLAVAFALGVVVGHLLTVPK